MFPLAKLRISCTDHKLKLKFKYPHLTRVTYLGPVLIRCLWAFSSQCQLLCTLHQPGTVGTAHLKQGQGRQTDCAATCVHGQRALHPQDLQEGISSSSLPRCTTSQPSLCDLTHKVLCAVRRKGRMTLLAQLLYSLLSLWVLTAALQQHQSIPECAWWSAFQISSSKSTNLLYMMLIPVFKLSFCCQTRITTSSSFHDCLELKEGSFSPATTCVNMRFGDMGTRQVLGTENSLKHAAC